MPSKKKRSGQKRLLSHTRPQSIHKSASTISSRATRALIRTHHTLQKRLAQAIGTKDEALAADLQKRIDAEGGLHAYQRASIQGQANERGGDSSRVLMGWLKEDRVEDSPGNPKLSLPPGTQEEAEETVKQLKPRLLEVGSLRPDNACARSGLFQIERIDLQSQHSEIREEDFMKRALPAQGQFGEDKFDVVSLSLVLNYTGDASSRGEMLKRVGLFLRHDANGSARWGYDRHFFPGLFLVLPAPCVLNSRYLDEEKLEEIMDAMGYRLLKRKQSKKLVYYYWKLVLRSNILCPTIGKQEIRKGHDRNNFAIVV